ncbi:MAG: SDR family NAD(P)-dependent oxidoreductase [Lautropia sp.]
MNRLADKKVVVIAAATGIGRSVVQLMAGEGADVLFADFGHEAECESLLADIRAVGRDGAALQADVRDADAVGRVIAEAHRRFGRIDVLVNNAGISGVKKPFHDQDLADFRNILDVNLMGVAYGMQHVLPIMLAQGEGSIINTASQLAHKPAPGNGFYCASKAAVVALSVSVAQEVAARGVRVNLVCPGPTDTPMWRKGDPAWARWKIESLPIRRIGTPQEIAWAYVYLASDESRFMVGQSLSPNGGDVMW